MNRAIKNNTSNPATKELMEGLKRNESVTAISSGASPMVSPDSYLFLSFAVDVGLVVLPANPQHHPIFPL